jgi:putative ABC transport system substrate-binding protein
VRAWGTFDETDLVFAKKDLKPRAHETLSYDGRGESAARAAKETESAAGALGIALRSLEVRGHGEFDSAFESARREHLDALITVEDPLTIDHRKQIVNFAATTRLPTIHGVREFVEVGGLTAHGANLIDLNQTTHTHE